MKCIYIIPKLFWFLFTIFLASGCDSQAQCNSCFQNGYDAGYREGYDAGLRDGRTAGFKDGRAAGYKDGRKQGFEEGFKAGYEQGFREGQAIGEEIGFVKGQKVFFSDSWKPTVAGAWLIFIFLVSLAIPLIALKRHYIRLWESYRLYLNKRELKSVIEKSGTSVSDALGLNELEELWQLVNATTLMNLSAQMESACGVPYASNDRLSQTYQEEFNQMKVRLIGIIATVMDIQNLDRTARFIEVFEAISNQKGLSTENKIQLLDQFKARLSLPC